MTGIFARSVVREIVLALAVLGVAMTVAFHELAPDPVPAPVLESVPSFSVLGDGAVSALLRGFYARDGYWRDCPEPRCWMHNGDWGSDALTNVLYLRGITTHDAAIPPLMDALARTARRYPPPCAGKHCLLWSDAPLWDSVATSREHALLPGDSIALEKAVAAFAAVEGSPAYGRGACPDIRYQRPYGRGDHLKTLETDSNGVKAALLLFDATSDPNYLTIAERRYAAIRRHFLDPQLRLYSVYVFDDGRHCTQVPHRFFASVNGNMIWNGLELYRFTGKRDYRSDAIATARDIARLADPNGVFMDLQAENDLAGPLVEAMFALATRANVDFARRWILTSASAAYSSRKADGTYGRFFDGPPPKATQTAWQTSGGLAAEIAAAALDENAEPEPSAWQDATFVPKEIARLPATIRFAGSGFALIGTLGEVCCEAGHARIFVDGRETTNGVGTWQNKSTSGQRLPDSILFAWRWRNTGRHVITLLPALYDAKEGGTFLHASGYLVRG